VSIDVLSPPMTEKLATRNIAQNAIPQLVDLARELNVNRGSLNMDLLENGL
jgi:hypothetical protein